MENLNEDGHRKPVWLDELYDVLDRLLQEDGSSQGAKLLSIIDRLPIATTASPQNNQFPQLLEFKPVSKWPTVARKRFAGLESSDVLLTKYPEEIRHAVRHKIIDLMLSGEVRHWGWLQLSVLLQQTAHAMMQNRK